MDQLLRLSTPEDDPDFYDDVVLELQMRKDEGVEVFGPVDQTRGAEAVFKDIVLALGHAGAFTAVYNVIKSFLTRNSGRELTLQVGGKKVTLKGHSLPEEKELLQGLGLISASP